MPSCRLQTLVLSCQERPVCLRACRFAYAAPEVLVQDPRGLSADIYRCAHRLCGATRWTHG